MNGIGVLLPISCLPKGKFSDGYQFVDWLVKNKYDYWQVLPLSPRDEFGSPYDSPNSLAIDPGYGAEDEWFALKNYANKKKIKIIGDLPYFITRTERDDLFIKGLFAGAPPDCFRKSGQRWGLPVYDWENKFAQNLKYLLKRIRRALALFDMVRLDHFRGYEAVWVYPGKIWLKVPGKRILKKVREEFPKQIFIAEDLGVITSEVKNLRKKFNFLGSAVIQFGENNNRDIVYYTSTHDTPTLKGFYGKESAIYLNKVLGSPAAIKIIPMWDILKLGNSARFNKPGTKRDNWGWKVKSLQIVFDHSFSGVII
ncbi:MAG: 4-alpha-glucanotransferase [Patescibacteria group bacterium]